MNFSVWNAARKWSCNNSACDQRPIAVVTLILLVMSAAPVQARISSAVPLPLPRPAQAPALQPSAAEEKPPEDAKPAAEPPVAAAPTSSACRLALTEEIAVAPSIPPIIGPGTCGGDDLVRLEAVLLPGKGRVAVKPAAILRCAMASAVADWIRTDMAPMASGLGTSLTELDNFDSFECRGRNRVVGAKMSEHGLANALDVRSLKLANGQAIALTERSVPRDLRDKVLASVCGRFSTVLGPGSDGYHEDHIHLDLASRRSGYRICQWNVYEAMPAVAPLLPAERPEEAPPREVAAVKSDETPAAVEAPSPPTAEPEPEQQAAPVAPAKTKRGKPRNAARDAPPPPQALPKASPPLPQKKPAAAQRTASDVAEPEALPVKPAPAKKRRRREPSLLPPGLRKLFQ